MTHRRAASLAAPLLLACVASAASLGGLACGSGGSGDPPADVTPNPLGDGKRVRDVTNPKDNEANATVTITSAEVTAVDTYDETSDGKSRGTVYVQDVASTGTPWSAVSLYSPTFIPANLRVTAGDVLDLTGQYQENKNIGAHNFPNGAILPQLSKPTGTFRFEYDVPAPTPIDVNDLADYSKGRQWISMLVQLKNITVTDRLFDDGQGRLSAHLTKDLTSPTSPTVTNELMAMTRDTLAAGKTYTSITGIVTFFDSLHVAPRSMADIVE